MHNQIQIEDKDFEILLENENINKRIRLIGIQLNVDYENRCPIFIGVLNGSFLFMSDLLKEIEIPCEVSFIRVSSYQGMQSMGKVTEAFGLPDNLHNRDVILVEDIVETGSTLDYIIKEVEKQEPASLKICTLLLKPKKLKIDIQSLEYIGFEIDNDFVVGYGLDYKELGRNLNSIYRATGTTASSK